MSAAAVELFRCLICNNAFSSSASGDSRIPCLLKCSHSICQICVANQESGEIRCPKCYELTEFSGDHGLPKNFYLVGLLQEQLSPPDEVASTQSTDGTMNCFCGALAFTSCDLCKKVTCDACFTKVHASDYFKDHKLVFHEGTSASLVQPRTKVCDEHRGRSLAFCVTCDKSACLSCSSEHSSHYTKDLKMMNAEQIPAMKKFKESLIKALSESLAAYRKYRESCKANKLLCVQACRLVDLEIAELIALLQNLSKERKAELQSALETYQQRLDLNEELWIADIRKLGAAISSIEGVINSDDHELDYKSFVESIENSIPTVARDPETPLLDANTFGVEIDREMKPKQVKKRIKIYAHLPTAQGAAKTLSVVAKPKQKSKSTVPTDTKNSVYKQPSTTVPVQPDSEQFLSQNLLLKTASAKNPEDEGDSSSSCFSDEEHVKIAHKKLDLKVKSSSSDGDSVKIVLQKSELSVKSTINESMLDRSDRSRPKTFLRGNAHYKPFNAPSTYQSKYKFPESQKKFEVPDKVTSKFDYYKAKITTFTSFDNFFVHQVEPKHSFDDKKLQRELNEFYKVKTNQKDVFRPAVGFCNAYKYRETWQRCTTMKVFSDQCEIFLFDLGETLKVPKADLKMMNPRFTKYKKVAIKCRLVDIAPNKNHGSSYTEKSIKAFKKLTMSSNTSMYVMVAKVPVDREDAVPVVIHIFPNNGLRINLNAYLVEREGCISTGPESLNMVARDEQAKPSKKSPMNSTQSSETKSEKKVEIEVLSGESPGSFFAAFTHLQNDFAKSIQHEAAILDNYQRLKETTKENWTVGDYCYLKHPSDNKDSKWYRGRVSSSLQRSSEELEVFLIDKGVSVKAKAELLIDAPDCVNSFRPPAAVKMHLADAIPLGGASSWNRSSVEMFKKVIQRFEEFCVSVLGAMNAEGSVPVTLWGVTNVKTILSSQKEFHDIGEYLVNEGYVGKGSKSSSENSKTDIAYAEDIDSSLDLSPRTIDAWIPAETTQVGEFNGIPTHVDDDGVIYIQTEDQHVSLKELTIKLTSQYSIYEIENSSLKVKLDQPVIVDDKITGGFYRGVVEKILKNLSYEIRFVDLGTIETIHRKDIFTKVIAADTPVLCQKFQLASVIPENSISPGEWSPATVAFIHGEIVDFSVSVSVKEVGDISSCSIKIIGSQKYIEATLVNLRMVRWRMLGDAWPSEKTRQEDDGEPVDVFVDEHLTLMKEKVREERLNEIAKALLKPDCINASPEETKRYLKGFEEDCNKEITESVMSMASQKSSNSSRKSSAKIIVRTSNQFETVFGQKKERKRTGVRPPKQIHFFDLQAADIENFQCTFAGFHSQTKLYLTPSINELSERIEELDNALVNVSESMLVKFKSLQSAVNKMCLAKVDSKWNRAMITGVSPDDQLVDVFLLDTAVCATVDAKSITIMDVKLYKFPKKTLAVVLAGLTVNPRLEDHEISKLVALTLGNRKLEAIVRSHDEKNFPVVELKDENHCLAYQMLIDNKVFIEIMP